MIRSLLLAVFILTMNISAIWCDNDRAQAAGAKEEAYTGDPRIIVSIEASNELDAELALEATVAAAEELSRTPGYKYISPYDLAAVRLKDPGFARKAPKDIRSQYSKESLAVIEEAVKPLQKEFLGGLEAMTAFDLMISGKISRAGGKIRLELKIMRNKSWRERDLAVEFPEDKLDGEVRAAVREILKAVAREQIVYADKVVNDDLSQVLYFVKTIEGSEITIGVDYTGDRPNPEIQAVKILEPASMEKMGKKFLNIGTLRGKNILVEFEFKDGKTYHVRVDTPMPDPSSDAEQIEKLEFRSNGGHILVFEFKWRDKKVEHAKLYPKVNAFSDERI